MTWCVFSLFASLRDSFCAPGWSDGLRKPTERAFFNVERRREDDSARFSPTTEGKKTRKLNIDVSRSTESTRRTFKLNSRFMAGASFTRIEVSGVRTTFNRPSLVLRRTEANKELL